MKKIYLILLMIAFASAKLAGQSSCENRLIIDQETSYSIPADQSAYWYEYTMPRDGKLVISFAGSMEYHIMSGDCESWTDYYISFESRNYTHFKSGQVIVIYWLSESNPMEWSLSVEDFSEGDNCEFAKSAVFGTNTIPSTENDELWYSYTMPDDGGKLQITFPVLEYNAVTVYKGDCNNLNFLNMAHDNLNVADLSPSETVYIKWNLNNQSAFEWDLSVVPLSDGDLCNMPLTAQLGTNNTPDVFNQMIYYEYRMKETKKLKITTSNMEEIRVFQGDCQVKNTIGTGNGSFEISSLAENERILIGLHVTDGAFEWTLEEVDFSTGDICSIAEEATSYNVLSSKPSMEYWYKYILENTGKLIIDTDPVTVSYIYSDCDSSYFKSAGGELIVYDLTKGSQVLIKMMPNREHDIEWTLEEKPQVIGDVCSDPLVANESNHILENHGFAYWYKYKVTKNGSMHLSSPAGGHVTVKKNCGDDNFLTSGGSELWIDNLEVDDEILIRWIFYDTGEINWNLDMIEPIEGANCSTAQTASFGEDIFLPSVTAMEFWYEFTMPEDARLKVTSSSNAYFTLYTSDCSNNEFISSQRSGGTFSDLESDESYFIKWDISGGADFTWSLNTEAYQPGDVCSMAVPAELGSNLVPSTNNNQYWFSYTMPEDKKIVLSSMADASLALYTNTCANLHYSEYGYGNADYAGFQAGETIYIKWSTSDDDNFSWDLSLEDIQPGENCTHAIDLTAGDQVFPANAEEIWYKYVAGEDQKITITPTTSNYCVSYTFNKGICGDISTIDWSQGTEAAEYSLAAGDYVFIKFSGSCSITYEWNLSTQPLLPGESCVTAIDIPSSGDIVLPTTALSEYWYRYTMTEDKKLNITSTAGENVEIITDECGEIYFPYPATNNISTAQLSAGESVFIKWTITNGGDFTWNLQEVDFAEGDNCLMADNATLGENVLPASTNMYYYYKFTMPEEGKLVIDSDYTNSVAMFKGSCATLDFDIMNTVGVGSTYLNNLDAGDEIIILWETAHNNEAKTWNMTILESGVDPECETAEFAISGMNTTPYAPYWYEYTAPVEGNYTISSVDLTNVDTDLEVVSDCYGTKIAYNDDYSYYQSQVTISLAENETIYIHWLDNWSASGFDWAITCDNNLPPVCQDQVFSLDENSANGTSVGFVSASDPENNPILFSIVGGNDLLTFEIDANSGEISVSDNNSLDFESKSVFNLVIRVEDDQGEIKESVVTINLGDVFEKLAQTISIDPIADQKLNAQVEMVATSSAGLPVNCTVESGPAVLNGSILTFTDTGNVVIKAEQAGDNNYESAETTISFNVVDPCNDFETQLVKKDDNLCAGDELGSIDVSVTGGNSPYVYQWSNQATSEDLDGLMAGWYTLKVSDQNNCLDSLQVEITALDAIPQPTITIDDSGSDIILSSSSDQGNHWYLNGVILPDENDAQLSVNKNGVYSVQVEQNGCLSAVSDPTELIETGFSHNYDNLEFILHPNPVSDFVTIVLKEKNVIEAVNIEIVDMAGKVTLSRNNITEAILEMDLRSLEKGCYLLKIWNSRKKSIKRIIIQ